MKRPNDTAATRERKASKILAILRDFLGDDLTGLTCLDVGSRDGAITHALAAHFGFVAGIDINALTSPRPFASLAQADGKKSPFPNHFFDVVICAQVYEHEESPAALIEEIHRVLKPGGMVFFSGPNRWAVSEEHYQLPLLSWLPQWLANHYLRITRRGRIYDIYPLSYRQLKKLWRGFEIHDCAAHLLSDPQHFFVDEHLRIGLPRWLAGLLKPLVPNFNWVLVKSAPKNTVPETAYTQEYYLTECDGYEEFASSSGESLPRRLRRPLEIADIQPDQHILDIGCGRGELAMHCARKGGQVWGLDYAPAALGLAAKLPKTEKMAFQQANATRLPFAGKSFDTILMLDIIEHLSQDELLTTLNQAWHALKPGGRVIIHTMPSLWYYRFGYPLYRMVQRLRGQALPKNPRSRWRFAHLHINEQTPLKLRKTFLKTQFLPKIWLESTQDYSSESNPFARRIMQGLTRLPPFKWVFCNEIFAVGTKPLR